jgi:polyhydroxybutyrate depolymerase
VGGISKRTAMLASAVLATVGLAACSSTSSPTTASLRSLPAVASSGCHQPAVAEAISTSSPSFLADGRSGTYLEEVPTGATSAKATPLVLNLHGYEEPASIQDAGSGLPAYGSAHGFYVVTPQLSEPGLPRWDFSKGSADVAWIAALLDLRRVYATGLSMGAYTTSSLACQLSDRLGAVAPVAGIQAFTWCRPSRPVPVIAFHGDADPILSYEGGLGPQGKKLPNPDGTGSIADATSSAVASTLGQQFLKPIPAQAAAWAARNGCGTPPSTSAVSSDTSLIKYPCAADASVELYVVHGGGHDWPGGPAGIYPPSIVGVETQTISADALMWQFFLDHPLPKVPA